MRKAAQISQTTIEIIIVIGIVITLNILGQFYYTRADLTEDEQYTLRKSSRDLVAGLKDLVYIKAYVSPNLPTEAQPALDKLKDLLEEYRAAASSKLVIQYINPGDLTEEEKTGLQQKGITERTYTISGANAYAERAAYFDLMIKYIDQDVVIPAVPDKDNLEYEITSAIVKVTSDKTYTIGFLTGHGELTSADALTKLTEPLKKLYTVQDVDLQDGQPVPDNVDVLVIAQPTQAFTERHRYVIDQFLMRGGKLVVMAYGIQMDQMGGQQATYAAVPLESLLGAYGVKIKNDLVADPDYSLLIPVQAQSGPTIVRYALFPFVFSGAGGFPSGSPATRGVGAVAFPYVSSLEIDYGKVPPDSNPEDDVDNVMELMKTSEKSYSYPAPVDLTPQQDFKALATDPKKQLIAVQVNGVFTSAFKDKAVPPFDPAPDALEGAVPKPDTAPMTSTSPETSLVVIGNGSFVEDGFLQFLDRFAPLNQFRPSNEIFMTNLLESLTLGETLIGIRSRAITPRLLKPDTELKPSQKNALKFWGYIFLPCLVAVIGITRFYLKVQRKRLLAAIQTSSQTPRKERIEPDEEKRED